MFCSQCTTFQTVLRTSLSLQLFESEFTLMQIDDYRQTYKPKFQIVFLKGPNPVACSSPRALNELRRE